MLVALAGCPPPPRYAVVQVGAPEPLAEAMVAARCGTATTATRTNDLGRARVSIRTPAPAARCSLTVAKPGYSTIETGGVELCDSPTSCPPIGILLVPR